VELHTPYISTSSASLLSYRRRKFRDLWNGPNGPSILFPQQPAARYSAKASRGDARRRLDDRLRRGWRRTGGEGGGVNYCQCIRRSLPIVVNSSVSLVLVACLWQPWNPPVPATPLLVVGDAEETAGVSVKGKPSPERRTFGRELRDGRRGEIAPIRRDFSRDNSVDNRESYESPDS